MPSLSRKRIFVVVVVCCCTLFALARLDLVSESKEETSARGAGMVPEFGVTATPSGTCTPITPGVLYDQTDNAASTVTSSQNFEAPLDQFDDQVADDFIVPAGQTWTVSSVNVTGQYFNGIGPANSVNVYFYTNSGNLPSTTAVCTYNNALITTGSDTGSFGIDLPSYCILTAGTYWVSVQANLDFNPTGQWGWTDRTVQSNNGAAFRNPGGGFACPGGNDWVVKPSCVTNAPPDNVFQLMGSLGVACGTPTATATATPTLTGTATETATATSTPTPTGCQPSYMTTTQPGSVTAATTNTGSSCDDCITPITLPFPVLLYGTPFTSAQADSNGVLAFTSAVTVFTNACLPNTNYTDAIFPHWDDLRTDSQPGCTIFPGGACGIFTAVTGSAPNRTFIIEWRTVYFATSTTSANFEVLLREGSSDFQIVYGTLAGGGTSATSGVQRGMGFPFTEFECNTGLANNNQVNYVLDTCSTPSPSPTATATVTNTPTATATNTPTSTPTTLPSPFPEYDLTISQADSPDPVVVGQHLTYTIVVTNSPMALGGTACPNVRFEYPTGVTFTFYSAGGTNGFNAIPDTDGITFTGGCLTSDGGLPPATATLTVVITPTAAGTLTSLGSGVVVDPENNWNETNENNNTAETVQTMVVLTGPTPTSTATNTPTQTPTSTATNTPTATATNTPFPELDLTISQMDSPDPVGVSQPLTYTLLVTNSPFALGGFACPNVRFDYPTGVSFSFGSASGDHGYNAVPDVNGITFTGGCLNSFSGPDTATLTVVIRPLAVGTMTSAGTNVVVDPQNTIPESNENNNTAQTVQTTVVTATPTPTNTPTHTPTNTPTATATSTATATPTGSPTPSGHVSFDYDADGRSDISVFRPSSGTWYLQQSTAGAYGAEFGYGTDKIVPADYDGDGRAEIAVYRPETGIWYIFNSSNGTVTYRVFGIAEDLPTPADYDGDGRADISVFRPSTATWYRQNSSDGSFYAIQFGLPEDKPTVGDFDGDGHADVAIFRPSLGDWYQLYSSDQSVHGERFGFGTDVITPADFDGDGKTDLAVFRPSNGFWYVRNSNGPVYTAFPFGLSNDIPAAGDFDGDGKADLSVFRPSDGTWYRMNSSDGSFFAYPFGTNGDKPTQTAFRY